MYTPANHDFGLERSGEQDLGSQGQSGETSEESEQSRGKAHEELSTAKIREL
jgi:hypothetical protein